MLFGLVLSKTAIQNFSDSLIENVYTYIIYNHINVYYYTKIYEAYS